MRSKVLELSVVEREEGDQSWVTSTHLPEGLSPKTWAISRMVGDMGPILKSNVLVPLFQNKRTVVRSSGLETTVTFESIISSYMSLFIHFFLKMGSSSFTHYAQPSSFINRKHRRWFDYLEAEMPTSTEYGLGVNQLALGILFSTTIDLRSPCRPQGVHSSLFEEK